MSATFWRQLFLISFHECSPSMLRSSSLTLRSHSIPHGAICQGDICTVRRSAGHCDGFDRGITASSVLALPLGPDSVIGGIFPTICRINHGGVQHPSAQHGTGLGAKGLSKVQGLIMGQVVPALTIYAARRNAAHCGRNAS
jgi:hypothetical protein